MSNKKSSQAIERFYLSDDPTLILESEEVADFNTELNELVQQKLEQAAKRQTNGNQTIANMTPEIRRQIFAQVEPRKDTAEDPFSYDYILERLESSILAAKSGGNTDEILRLQGLLRKMETEELTPIQIVREAWLKND